MERKAHHAAAPWIAVALTLRRFARVSPAAAFLLPPHSLRTGFAAGLNLSIWILNP